MQWLRSPPIRAGGRGGDLPPETPTEGAGNAEIGGRAGFGSGVTRPPDFATKSNVNPPAIACQQTLPGIGGGKFWTPRWPLASFIRVTEPVLPAVPEPLPPHVIASRQAPVASPAEPCLAEVSR